LGIDRIGKGASAPPEGVTPKEGASKGSAVGAAAPFEVSRKEMAPATPVQGVTASPALEGLKSGALDAKGYLDAKVDEATSHLTHLSPAQLDTVKSIVRAELSRDPNLAGLFQHATGSAVPTED
jgi:hypothetical protein